MKIKSLLLCGAAGLTAVAGASIAATSAAQAQNVQAGSTALCGQPGSNNFYLIPGTQTCLRIGGTLGAEASYANRRVTFSFGNSGNGVQPSANSVITVAGQDFTFGVDITIGATVADTIDDAVAVLNASANPDVAAYTYYRNGPRQLVAVQNTDTGAQTPGTTFSAGANTAGTGRAGVTNAGGTNFNISAELRFETRSSTDFGLARSRFHLGISQSVSDDPMELTLLNGSNNFPFIVAGSNVATTRGATSSANFLNAGFAGNGFGYSRGTTSTATTGGTSAQTLPMVRLGTTPYNQTFNTGAGNLTLPVSYLGDGRFYASIAAERQGVSTNNPTVITGPFVGVGGTIRLDWVGTIGYDGEDFDVQASGIFSPHNSNGYGLLLGMRYSGIDNVEIRAQGGYFSNILSYVSAPTGFGNFNFAGTTGWFVTAGVDWDVTDDLSVAATVAYAQDGVHDYMRAALVVGYDNIGGIAGLSAAFRATYLDLGQNIVVAPNPEQRSTLFELDIDYVDAFGIDGFALGFDTNYLLDQTFSYRSFDFLPYVQYSREFDVAADTTVSFGVRADAGFSGNAAFVPPVTPAKPFGFDYLVIGGPLANPSAAFNPLTISNTTFDRDNRLPFLEFEWRNFGIALSGDAVFNSSFQLDSGNSAPDATLDIVFSATEIGGLVGASIGFGFEWDPTLSAFDITTEFDFSRIFDMLGLGFQNAGFTLEVTPSFTGLFVFQGLGIGLGFETEFQGGEFESTLDFTFDNNLNLTSTSWQNDFTTSLGSTQFVASFDLTKRTVNSVSLPLEVSASATARVTF